MTDPFLISFPLWLPAAAVVLDWALGDPARLPHPVRAVGWFLGKLQGPLLRARRGKRAAGVLALMVCLAASGGAALGLINLPGVLGVVAALYLSYAGLALGCLVREGRRAARLIEWGGLDEAREAVGMLVSRQTGHLERPALRRALAETLSENFNDGFVAPLFWLMIGGPVGLWIYKAASTADSMWGYKHEPWRLAGWAAARLDDVLAFVPARLAALFLYLAGPKGNWPGWGRVREDAGSMESPNAGWSMAAAAWLQDAGMGGPAVYAGKAKEKPWLGPRDAEWDGLKIQALLRRLQGAGLVCFVFFWLALCAGRILC